MMNGKLKANEGGSKECKKIGLIVLFFLSLIRVCSNTVYFTEIEKLLLLKVL